MSKKVIFFMIDEGKNNKWNQIKCVEECFSCKDYLSCNNLQCPSKNIIFGKKYHCREGI